MRDIATVDYAEFSEGTSLQKQRFATELVDSFIETGFVKVVNHGIPHEMIDELFQWNKRFFALPNEAKAHTAHPPSRNTPQRGWSAVGVESTGYLRAAEAKDVVDEKEHFDQGSTCDLEFPNRWPLESDIPGFRAFMESYYDAIYATSIKMLIAMEVGLKLEPGSFTKRCHPSASDLRLNHYPSIRVRELKSGRVSRIWPHTDFGLITPLFQDGIGGLEAEDRTNPGNFVPVLRENPYEMILNVSDTLEHWTNGIMKSGVHTVKIPVPMTDMDEEMIPERYSVAFFFKADRRQRVAPLADFIAAGEKPKYRDMSALELQILRTQTMYKKD